jgi:tubulin polyglutamylase TTLL6/13
MTPYLLDGLKFDLRLYVLVTGSNPLRLFLYEEGFARFATEKYEKPKASNISNCYIHLTNYAINKNHPEFIFNKSEESDNKGHKRSLTTVFSQLQKLGVNVDVLWLKI